ADPRAVQTRGDAGSELRQHLRAHVPVLGRLIAERFEHHEPVRLAQPEEFVHDGVGLVGPDVLLELPAALDELALALRLDGHPGNEGDLGHAEPPAVERYRSTSGGEKETVIPVCFESGAIEYGSTGEIQEKELP